MLIYVLYKWKNNKKQGPQGDQHNRMWQALIISNSLTTNEIFKLILVVIPLGSVLCSAVDGVCFLLAKTVGEPREINGELVGMEWNNIRNSSNSKQSFIIKHNNIITQQHSNNRE